MKKSFPLKKPESPQLVAKSHINYFRKVTKEIANAIKSGFSIHALMLASAIIEESVLPYITDTVLSRLGIIEKKKILISDNFAIKNALYFALTQDEDLYLKLDRFRKTRNKITHKIFSYQDLNKMHKEARVGIKYFVAVLEGVEDRLKGKIPIPVLTYYPKGWNEALNESIKVIKGF